ncbi:MAG: hypothetical protein EA426_03865 [Spirochaetaceae bacterium]|nr:MAG: hypothetical protein EA426_03865 [Spirochaetaceae bacterium]
MNTISFLESSEELYDDSIAMLKRNWVSSGYHSMIPTGTPVHSTRETFYYAVALIRSGDRKYIERGHRVISACIALQDQDPTSKTYGIWPYTFEESLEQMAPPDWNWADFCGAPIALMLHDDLDTLEPSLVETMRRSLVHAAYSIFRRNVQSGYTNIAIMGGGVTAATGELLEIPFLVEYGRKRLENFVEHTKYHGDFNEYNSPTYTMVALEEAERILHLVHDPVCRDCAEWIRRHAWKVIADHFHPATQQWAGPNSRTYADYIRYGHAKKLSRQTGVSITVVGEDEDTKRSILNEIPPFFPEPPCPPEIISRFSQLPADPCVLSERFFRGETEHDSVYGYTWLTDGACLGSINHDTMWTQRRGLLGYWPVGSDAVAFFRCQFLKDGKDFASVGIVNAQDHNSVLTGACFLDNKGDYHIHLDRPSNGRFSASTLLLRFSVHARGARVVDLGGGVFEIGAGEYAARIYTTVPVFDGREIEWRTGTSETDAWLEAVCRDGDLFEFTPSALGETRLIAGTEIITIGAAAASRSAPTVSDAGDRWNASWKTDRGTDLSIVVPKTCFADF